MDLMGQWNNIFSQITHKQVDKSVSTAEFGNLIEFVHTWSGLSLWGVYVGNGNVIHFGVGDNMMQKLSHSFLQQMIRTSAGGHALKTKICIQPITEIKVLYGTRIKVNNSKHNLTPSTADLMNHRCLTFLHQEFKYDYLNFNSEHFATFVRYGYAVCNQIPFKKKDEVHMETTQTLEMIIQQRMETET
ncbi:hypothetical protein LDENG_00035580 [Lucifuga dentata]|nr:hypothetical protein LDENG_00035580 [Lucifuga dentata]